MEKMGELKMFIRLHLNRGFATKKPETLVAGLGKKVKKLLTDGKNARYNVEVEKDAKKLVSEVCGTNLLAEGGENIRIKPDSEYPDWLWKVHLGEPLKLEEMDVNTKQYWNKVNYLGKRNEKFLITLQKHKMRQK